MIKGKRQVTYYTNSGRNLTGDYAKGHISGYSVWRLTVTLCDCCTGSHHIEDTLIGCNLGADDVRYAKWKEQGERLLNAAARCCGHHDVAERVDALVRRWKADDTYGY